AAGHDLHRGDVAHLGHALDELAEAQLFDRGQTHVQAAAQIGAQRVAQVAREALVQTAHRARLLAGNLPGLAEVAPGQLPHPARPATLHPLRGAEERVDFVLMKNAFHGLYSSSAPAAVPASAGAPSRWRRRSRNWRSSPLWSWEMRDSPMPSTAPTSFMVSSSK